MRILHVIFHLLQGGTERFAVDLCNRLADNPQDEIHLLTILDDTIPGNSYFLGRVQDNVFYHNLKQKNALKPKSLLATYKAIKEIDPDIVHMHCSTIPAYLPALLNRKPAYIHTIHGIADKAISFKWLRPIQRWFFKRELIHPVTISDTCHETYRRFYQLENGTCITNGIEPALQTPIAGEANKLIEDYKKGPDIPVFLHVARCSAEKNQQLLFDTFNKLHEEGKKFLLLVIGDGYGESEYIKLNDTKQIRILGTRENIGDYLACADFFILTSLWEGLPLSVLEAMSAGCIIISTPAGGVPDIVKDGTNGFLSPDFTTDGLYRTIIRAMGNRASIDKNAIKEQYLSNHTMERCAGEYANLYNKLHSE